MGSISTEIRTKQKEQAVAEFDAYKARLNESGKDEKEMRRDPKLRALKAIVRKANKRLEAIDARQAHVDKVKAEKAAKPKQAEDTKGKGKKAKGQPAPDAAKGKKQAQGQAQGQKKKK